MIDMVRPFLSATTALLTAVFREIGASDLVNSCILSALAIAERERQFVDWFNPVSYQVAQKYSVKIDKDAKPVLERRTLSALHVKAVPELSYETTLGAAGLFAECRRKAIGLAKNDNLNVPIYFCKQLHFFGGFQPPETLLAECGA
ncbi:hypothetical protein NBRC116594_11420 [Shimia sp. NS0008-38b]|uniref:hypothetical protein n=1 Tax=Shimia sp. NS0008-38b TaxID=3127653 RepID=UPI003102DE4F